MEKLNIDLVKNEKIKFCIFCDCYLDENNTSDWEVFIDKTLRTYRQCKACELKNSLEPAKKYED